MIKELVLEVIYALPIATAIELDDPRWRCPIAGNVESGIYHTERDRYYENMLRAAAQNPMRVACFATEEEAAKSGYRKANTRRRR